MRAAKKLAIAAAVDPRGSSPTTSSASCTTAIGAAQQREADASRRARLRGGVRVARASCSPTVAAFFDKGGVMVMDPDPELRDNRLGAARRDLIAPFTRRSRDFRQARRRAVPREARPAVRRRRRRGPRRRTRRCSAARARTSPRWRRSGLPVPPGFTITTEVCRHVMEHGAAATPTGSTARSRGARARRGARRRRSSATRRTPLLVSVRSGAPRVDARA